MPVLCTLYKRFVRIILGEKTQQRSACFKVYVSSNDFTLNDTHTALRYSCRECFCQLEKAIKFVDFLNPLIISFRKSVRMSPNISLAARSTDIVDDGAQYTDETNTTPLEDPAAKESTSNSDTEQG